MSNAAAAPPSARLLRLKEVMQLVALGRSTIYDRMAAGTFPRSRDLGGGTVRWRADEVQAWIDACPVSAATALEQQ